MRRIIPMLIVACATAILTACGDNTAPRRDDGCENQLSGYVTGTGYVCP